MKDWQNIVFGVLIIVFVTGMLYINKFDRKNVAFIAATNHIKVVTAVGRNCNDCHLGASFVNLFNNDAVKANDNTILLMMDNAKIKRF